MNPEVIHLMEEIRSSIFNVRGDLENMIDNFNKIHEHIRAVPRSMRWRVWVRDNPYIKEIKWFNKLDDLLLPFDPDSISLQPWDMSRVPEEHRSRLDYIMGHMTMVGGFTKIWNTLTIIILCAGQSIFESEILQRFKWYLMQFDNEPFREFGADGGISVDCRDAAVTLRVKLTLNALWNYVIFKDGIDPELIVENWTHFFVNPQERCLKAKDFKHTHVSLMFAGSTSGSRCKWTSMDLDDMVQGAVSDWSEKELLIAYKKELDDDYNAMVKAGLPKLAKKLRSMLTAEVNSDNMAFASWVVFYEAMTGYWRGDYPKIFQKSIEESYDRQAPKNPPFAKYIIQLWMEFCHDWKIPTKKEFFSSIISELTTRSAGNLEENIDSVSFEYEGRNYEWKFTDKVSAFFHNPEKYLNEENFMKSLTPEDAGLIFLRNVMARKDRAIFAGKLNRHIIESLFVRHLMAWMSNQLENNRPKYTLEIDTGRPFTDHREWLYHSAIGDRFILLTDFSNYDQTEQFDNVRNYHIIGIQEGSRGKYMEEIMWGKNAVELIVAHWTSLNNAVYRLRTDKNKHIFLRTNFLLSGEFATLALNNVCNAAFFRYLMENTAGVFEWIQFETVRIQGDDQIAMYTLTDKWYQMNDTEKSKAIMSFVKLVSKCADDNGLVVNANKTGFRRGSFEFLKKMGIFGYIIPRYLQVNLQESERITRVEDAVLRMSARAGQIREWMWRGGVYDFAVIRLYYEWNFIRSVKGKRMVKKDKNGKEVILRKDIRLPFEILFVPLSKGGVGILPTSIIDPNVDFMIMKHSWPERTRKIMCLYVMAREKVSEGRLQALSAKLFPAMKKGELFMRQHENDQVSKLSKDAYEYLVAKNYVMRDPYFNRYERTIRESIEDNPKSSRFKSFEKQQRALEILKLMENMKNNPIVDFMKSDALDGVNFIEQEEMPLKLPINPIAGLDKYMGLWLRNIGTSSSPNTVGGDLFKLFAQVVKSPLFPKNLKSYRPEAMAKELVESHLLEIDEIAAFLMAKGGEATASFNVAKEAANKLQQLLFLSDISLYSVVGEGYSQKDIEAITRYVEVQMPLHKPGGPVSDLLLNYGFQYMRTRPLKDQDGNYIPRRRVRVTIDDNFLEAWLSRKFRLTNLAAFSFIEPIMSHLME